MTDLAAPSAAPAADAPGLGHRLAAWIPTWGLITTRQLELRKRRGLMVTLIILTIGLPVIVLGIRLLFHAVDPKSYGPAGTPSVFDALMQPMAEFGFIIAAVLGATAGSTDLSEGVFRHLVITGRSRLALYLARLPSGLSLVLPAAAVGFTFLCLVTNFAGTPQPRTISVNGVAVPVNLTETQLGTWIEHHERLIAGALPPVLSTTGNSPPTLEKLGGLGGIYSLYTQAEDGNLNPPNNEMVKIGLWLELDIGVGYVIGLGLGSLLGQRTLSSILMIALEIILTPILANVTIAHFINGQRVLVGVALDQLRPAALASAPQIHGHGVRIFGGAAASNLPPMPTWAMVTVIVGWVVGWSGLGAWRMMTRDA